MSCRSAWNNPEHKRAFALGWFDLSESCNHALGIGFAVKSIRLHYSCSNYRIGDGPRLHERILDSVANGINQRWFERLCIYWFGGYEEIDAMLIKN
jgi:hypothetical protein